MSRRFSVYMVLFAAVCFSLDAHAEMRTWKLSGGFTFTGELLSQTDTQVDVLRNGTRYSYPVAAFSKEDQQYISKAPAAGQNQAAPPVQPAVAAEGVIARYTFDSATPEKGASILGAESKDGLLNLDGSYEHSSPPGYRAVFEVPRLDYSHFTVAARLKPERDGILLVGGTSYRWLKIKSMGGKVVVSINNKLSETISKTRIHEGRWITLALSFDQSAGEIVLYLNGSKEGKINLPKGFQHEVVGSGDEQADKQWTTTDYSDGTSFKGQLDELVIFGGVLTPNEASKLSLGASNQQSSGTVKHSAAQSAPGARPQAAGQQGGLRFELQGYEVSQDTTAMLFIAQPNDFEPKSLLTTISALVGTGAAKLVKLPFVEARSGERASAVPIGGYSLDADLNLGADRKTLRVVYVLRRASAQSSSATEITARIGEVVFLGTLPGASANTVVLVFCRITQL